MLFTQDIRKRLEVTKNARFSYFQSAEREREREREREKQIEREISGEHDNISKNLRILYDMQMSLTIVLFSETEDASLIYRGYPRTSA